MFIKVYSHEFPHGIAVVDGIFHTFVREDEPARRKVHPQHGFDIVGRSSGTVLIVMRTDQLYEFLPRDDGIHGVQEFFPAGNSLTDAVFQIGECLLICRRPICFTASIAASFCVTTAGNSGWQDGTFYHIIGQKALVEIHHWIEGEPLVGIVVDQKFPVFRMTIGVADKIVQNVHSIKVTGSGSLQIYRIHTNSKSAGYHTKNKIFPFIFRPHRVHNMSRERSKPFSKTKFQKMNGEKSVWHRRTTES